MLNRNKQTKKLLRKKHKLLPAAHVATPEISPNRYRMYKEKSVSDSLAYISSNETTIPTNALSCS